MKLESCLVWGAEGFGKFLLSCALTVTPHLSYKTVSHIEKAICERNFKNCLTACQFVFSKANRASQKARLKNIYKFGLT